MYLVAIAWAYVVLMMALVEALSPQGTVLGALVTFMLYGVVPLGIVLYLMGTPARKRARLEQEAIHASSPPDAGSHPAGHTVSPERKEP